MKHTLLAFVFLSLSALSSTHHCKTVKRVEDPQAASDFNALEFTFEVDHQTIIPYILRNIDYGTQKELGVFSFPELNAEGEAVEKGVMYRLGLVQNMARDLGFSQEQALEVNVRLTERKDSYKGHIYLRLSTGEIIEMCISCTRMDVFIKKD